MVEINGVVWAIKFVQPYDIHLFRNDGSLTIGMCDSSLKTIYINENLNGYMLKKVLSHELVHASIFSYGIYLTEEQEEIVANIISTYGEEIIQKTNLIFQKLSYA